ncbi:unnamed protein product [Sphagnum tenellum]
MQVLKLQHPIGKSRASSMLIKELKNPMKRSKKALEDADRTPLLKNRAVIGFFYLILSTMGCGSWQGTSADRGSDQHYGSGADWNKGNGEPGSGGFPISQEHELRDWFTEGLITLAMIVLFLAFRNGQRGSTASRFDHNSNPVIGTGKNKETRSWKGEEKSRKDRAS